MPRVFPAPPFPAANCASAIPGISTIFPKASRLFAFPVSSILTLLPTVGGKLRVTYPKLRRLSRENGFVVDHYPNRIGRIIYLVHWIIFSLGAFQRGNVKDLFAHAYYEPVLIQILMFLDLPGIFLASVIFKAFSADLTSFGKFVIFFVCISLELFLIGHIVNLFSVEDDYQTEA